MDALLRHAIAQKLVSLASVSFLLLGALGISHLGMPAMSMGGDMTMADCHTPGVAAVCTMSPLEHIASWQRMFTSLSSQSSAGMVLLLVFIAAIAGLVWARQVLAPPLVLCTVSHFVRKRDVPSRSPLQEFFSNGILNPKLH